MKFGPFIRWEYAKSHFIMLSIGPEEFVKISAKVITDGFELEKRSNMRTTSLQVNHKYDMETWECTYIEGGNSLYSALSKIIFDMTYNI